ncbi:hypothetical protein [Micromonospora orduensis]|uniref:hypothetical protein n=1 Tax=Micromonospora orduensis TaxID=1420891 RepID=UPI0033D8FA8A
MFSELAKPDERTLRFTPYGLSLGGTLHPDDALAFQRSVVADAVLTEGVPAELRKLFERLRHKHGLGLVDYEQFTEVADDAIGLYEPALRARFSEFYRGRPVPFANKEGRPQPLTSDKYDDIADHLRKNALYLPSSNDRLVRFRGMLTNLLWWARDQGLLRGQRVRRHEELIVKMRNHLSHARTHHIHTPVDAAISLRDLAEFINQLWGVTTPGGRRYPAPVRREVVAVGWSPNAVTTAITQARNLTSDEDSSWRWVLIRAVPDDYEVERFDSWHVTTRLPADYLWGPGTAADAVAWQAAHQPTTDEVDPVDRLYVLRQDGNRLYLPQTPEAFAATPLQQQRGQWYLLRADIGNDAFVCVRAQLDPNESHSECRCPVDRLARGSWDQVRGKLRHLQPNLVPHLPADVRVPSQIPWPRSVEIPGS